MSAQQGRVTFSIISFDLMQPDWEGRHAKIVPLVLTSQRDAWAIKIRNPGDYRGRHLIESREGTT